MKALAYPSCASPSMLFRDRVALQFKMVASGAATFLGENAFFGFLLGNRKKQLVSLLLKTPNRWYGCQHERR